MPKQTKWFTVAGLMIVLALAAGGCDETPLEFALRAAATVTPATATATETLPAAPGEAPTPTPTLPSLTDDGPTPTPTIPLPTATPTIEPPTKTPASTPTPTATPAPQAVISSAGNVNLRRGPGTEYAIAGTARSGDTLTLLGRNPASNWFNVETAGGLSAWVYATLVTLDVDPSTLEVVDAPPPAGGQVNPPPAGDAGPGDQGEGDETPEAPPQDTGQPLEAYWFIANAYDNPDLNKGYHTIWLDARGGTGSYLYYWMGEQLDGPSFVADAVSCSGFYATEARVEDTAGNAVTVQIAFNPFCPTPIGCADCPLWQP